MQVPIARRHSGGGTVFHDLGNANVCYMLPRTDFSQQVCTQLMLDVLNDLEIDGLHINARNDIIVQNGLKVSGSAFRLSGERSYHHATLLIASDLERLKPLLKSPFKVSENFTLSENRSVASVPSPTTNLSAVCPAIPLQQHFDWLIDRFCTHLKLPQVTLIENLVGVQAIKHGSARDMANWSWVFGHTPVFSVFVRGIEKFRIERGVIVENGQKFGIDVIEQLHNKEAL